MCGLHVYRNCGMRVTPTDILSQLIADQRVDQKRTTELNAAARFYNTSDDCSFSQQDNLSHTRHLSSGERPQKQSAKDCRV